MVLGAAPPSPSQAHRRRAWQGADLGAAPPSPSQAHGRRAWQGADLGAAPQAADGDELEDAVLDVLQPVVVLVQDL